MTSTGNPVRAAVLSTLPLLALLLLIIADVLRSWSTVGIGGAEKALLAICLLGTVGLAWGVLTSKKCGVVAPWMANLLLTVYSLLFFSIAAESALRIFKRSSAGRIGYYTPGSKWLSKADPRYTPGVTGDAYLSINEWGVRGPSTSVMAGRNSVYKILTLGGSTTICPFLDDAEEWPNRLMNNLNSMQSSRFVFVGNSGVRGHTTADHLKFLDSLPVVRNADMLTFLVGVNDLIASLAFEGASSHSELEQRAEKALLPFAKAQKLILNRLELAQ